MVEIRAERLLLRPAKEGDLAELHDIFTDARAMSYWSTPPHKDIAETREWLESMRSIDPNEGEDFIIELEGRVIGKAGFHRFPEVGYILRPDAWGQGFAFEALGAVLDRAFAVHRMESVEADVDPRNEPSLRLLARFGFVEFRRAKRTWLIADQWCDSVYLRLDASAWKGGGRQD